MRAELSGGARHDPVRRFLRSGLEARVEVRRRQRRVAELASRCARVTAPTDGTEGDGHRLWALLADERDREQESIRAELEQYHRVERFIDRLDDPVGRTVLRLRYLEGLGWTQLQQRLYRDGVYYSERQIYRLHGAALEEARRHWAEEGDGE